MCERVVCPYTVIARVKDAYTNEVEIKQERGKQYDVQIDNEEWNRKCGAVRGGYSCGGGGKNGVGAGPRGVGGAVGQCCGWRPGKQGS